jgi:type II secretory pathway component PulF
VPHVVPPQVNAMLKTGERIGDVAKVLPACRLLLRDGLSQVRGALNYLILLGIVVGPGMIVAPVVIRLKILPSFQMVFEGMLEGSKLPEFTRLLFAGQDFLTVIQVTILALVWLVALAYVAGPRLRGPLQFALPGLTDGLLYRLPWRRKRLHRDFSAMLAILLDAAVPESEAVAMAAESTDNEVIRRRAQKVCALLHEGVKLPHAMRGMDDAGELRWRLANGLHGGGFVRALAGWHEVLDAKAFQLEQAAAQITTTALVLFNGFIVACIVIGMFLVLVELLNRATLW